MSAHLTDRQELILIMVRDKKILQKMADALNVAIRTAAKEVEFLIDLGLVELLKNENGKTKMNGRQLTNKGKEWLKQHGYDLP